MRDAAHGAGLRRVPRHGRYAMDMGDHVTSLVRSATPPTLAAAAAGAGSGYATGSVRALAHGDDGDGSSRSKGAA